MQKNRILKDGKICKYGIAKLAFGIFDSKNNLFKDNAQYVRTALVAASAVFGDVGDKCKPEYLETIIADALERVVSQKFKKLSPKFENAESRKN